MQKNPVSCHKMCCSHAVLRILPTNQLTKNINFCSWNYRQIVSAKRLRCAVVMECKNIQPNQLTEEHALCADKGRELP
ncbi:hypothetical protein NQZ68_010525 [Dissostichus eleginoides]|nr:hypothetical protein NQZ68_010525 [Dissostichus eleginoides]